MNLNLAVPKVRKNQKELGKCNLQYSQVPLQPEKHTHQMKRWKERCEPDELVASIHWQITASTHYKGFCNKLSKLWGGAPKVCATRIFGGWRAREMCASRSGAGELRGRELRALWGRAWQPRYWDLFPMPFVPTGNRGGSLGCEGNVPWADVF